MRNSKPLIAEWVQLGMRRHPQTSFYFCGYCGKDFHEILTLFNHVVTDHQDKAQ